MNEYGVYAHGLLEFFVANAKEIYGAQFLVYNMHSLLHLHDQAKLYGNLEYCSAFEFENYMQVIKGMLRHGNNPLAQLTKEFQSTMIANL